MVETQIQNPYDLTPQSYKIEHDFRAIKEGISPEAIRRQIDTFLRERAMLSTSLPVNMQLDEGKLFSREYSAIPLEQQYANSSHQPIYDYRIPADVSLIKQIQEKANKGKDFAWVDISPTTQIGEAMMSRQSMIQIGVFKADIKQARYIMLTIPHRYDEECKMFRQNQSVAEAQEEMWQLLKLIHPSSVRNPGDNELNIIMQPRFFEDLDLTSLTLEKALINFANSEVSVIDKHMKQISGIEYLNGSPEGMYSAYNHQAFGEIFKILWNKNIISMYLDSLSSFDGSPDAYRHTMGLFNNIVNKFDYLWEQKDNLHVNEVEFEHMAAQMINETQIDFRIPRAIAAGCGKFGGKSALEIANYSVDIGAAISGSDYMKDKVECDCGHIWYVRNLDSQTYQQFCPNCKKDMKC